MRVTVTFLDYCSTGSGFFLNKDGLLATCFHVAFGKDLKELREEQEFKEIEGENEEDKLREYYDRRLFKAEVEFWDGSRAEAVLDDFDAAHDVAFFKVRAKSAKIHPCKIDWDYELNYGEMISFGGFPDHWDYKREHAPFAVQEGMVSSFIKTSFGGEKYEHIQINTTALEGNSGAPLFRGRSRVVVGMINGIMTYGSDDVLFHRASGHPVKGSLKTPLGISYATSMKTLRDESPIFNYLNFKIWNFSIIKNIEIILLIILNFFDPKEKKAKGWPKDF